MLRLLVGLALLGAFSIGFSQQIITEGAIPADCAGEFLGTTILWMNGLPSTNGGLDDNEWTEHCLRDGFYYLITPDNVFGYTRYMPTEWAAGGLQDLGSTDGSLANLVDYTSNSATTATKRLRMSSTCYSDTSFSPARKYFAGSNLDGTNNKFYVGDCTQRAAGASAYQSAIYNSVRLPQALMHALGFVGAAGYETAVGARFSEGTRQSPPPTWPGPPDYNGSDPADPSTTTDPSDPGGGGTDWGSAPGDSETNCSIIDIPCNLRRLFVPQEDWAGRWLGVRETASTKIPFGFGTWMTEVTSVTGTYYDAAPNLSLGTYTIGTRSWTPVLDFAEVDAFVWWHENGRMWLFWIFLASIPWVLFKLVMQ